MALVVFYSFLFRCLALFDKFHSSIFVRIQEPEADTYCTVITQYLNLCPNRIYQYKVKIGLCLQGKHVYIRNKTSNCQILHLGWKYMYVSINFKLSARRRLKYMLYFLSAQVVDIFINMLMMVSPRSFLNTYKYCTSDLMNNCINWWYLCRGDLVWRYTGCFTLKLRVLREKGELEIKTWFPRDFIVHGGGYNDASGKCSLNT